MTKLTNCQGAIVDRCISTESVMYRVGIILQGTLLFNYIFVFKCTMTNRPPVVLYYCSNVHVLWILL